MCNIDVLDIIMDYCNLSNNSSSLINSLNYLSSNEYYKKKLINKKIAEYIEPIISFTLPNVTYCSYCIGQYKKKIDLLNKIINESNDKDLYTINNELNIFIDISEEIDKEFVRCECIISC